MSASNGMPDFGLDLATFMDIANKLTGGFPACDCGKCDLTEALDNAQLIADALLTSGTPANMFTTASDILREMILIVHDDESSIAQNYTFLVSATAVMMIVFKHMSDLSSAQVASQN